MNKSALSIARCALTCRQTVVSGQCRQYSLKKPFNVTFNTSSMSTLKASLFSTNHRNFHSTRPAQAKKKDYYEILGVDKGADANTIKKSYYQLAKQYHPDTNTAPDAADKFAEISGAYEVLKDEEKRAQYDRFGHDAESFEQAGYGPGPGFNPEDILKEMFFGGRMGGMGGNPFGFGGFGDAEGASPQGNTRPRQGNDIQTSVNLTFMEAVNGCQKSITVNSSCSCAKCSGQGTKPGTKSTTCAKCGGTGFVRMMRGMFLIENTCSSCGGAGKSSTPCDTCHGDTVVSETRTVLVTVPPGVDSNTNLRLVNQGDAGFKNGPRGHLWVKVQVARHPDFKRDGTDVHVTVPLPLHVAILGGTVDVPTLNGSATLKVPGGTQPNDQQIMRNKGIKVVNKPQYGHQYIHFNVTIPKTLTPKARELVEELAGELDPSLKKETVNTKSNTNTNTDAKNNNESDSKQNKKTDETSNTEEKNESKNSKKKKKGLFSKLGFGGKEEK